MLKIIYKDWSLGGAETLLIRIGKFFNSKGINTEVYCERFFSEEIKSELYQARLIVQKSSNAIKSAFIDIRPEDSILVVTMYDYIECLSIKNAHNCENQVYYYVVHKYNPLHTTRIKIVDRITKNKYKTIIESSMKNGHVFFMDEICRDVCLDHYSIANIDTANIVYLPMHIQPMEIDSIKEKACDRNKVFTILSIARSDFPFKGYLRGLIEVYKELFNTYPNIRLLIISSGNELPKLKQWVKSANPEVSETIVLKESIMPSELQQYYKSASCYVGLGTTVLDACNYGVPALPIESYTYDLNSRGFFSEVDGFVGVPTGTGENAKKYLIRILEMTDWEYLDLAKKCRDTFVHKHSIQHFYSYVNNERVPASIRIPFSIKTELMVRRLKHSLKTEALR